MGKGGIPLEMGPTGVKSYKLEHMATEELRKWAKSYGEKDSAPREELLETLVGAFACS
jgi:hypothetical protein